MLTKLPSNSIKKGMFVAQLDRPWLESPFMLQGFMVETDEELDQLSSFSSFVYIDTDLSVLEDDEKKDLKGPASPQVEMAEITLKTVTNRKAESASKKLSEQVEEPMGKVTNLRQDDADQIELKKQRLKAAESTRAVHDKLEVPSSFVMYTEETSVEEELEVAKEVHEELVGALNDSFAQLEQKGELDVSDLHDSTESLVESMIRNPDAAHLLSQLRQKDSYSYSHSIEAAVLGVMFGRHLGFSKKELDELALGILLLDVGKTKLPTALLEKVGKLNATEVKLIKTHVLLGVKILEGNTSVSRDVMDLVASHHERFDGKGYPKGKAGKQISVYGRIAAIIDFYDAVTHDRPYRNKIKPATAVNALYARRGRNFQPELVEEFIQCLGLYPTGSVVELSSGEVGIVIEQNRLRRLRPKVLVVLDELKKEVLHPQTVDLDKVMADQQGNKLMIKNSLPSDAYGICRDDYYL